MNAQEAKAAVLARYGSIHAFCRRHAGPETGLKRSTVYMVLAGRYPGRAAPQLQKIQAALEGTPQEAPKPALPTAEALGATLQAIRCRHCRTLDKSRCGACRGQTIQEAQILSTYLAGDA